MAQHYLIENFTQKKFSDIKLSICNWFEKQHITTIHGSLKYERINRQYEKDYRINPENENEEVYQWYRPIPEGIIWQPKGEKGMFEIHFDSKLRKVLQIYLVA